jgi:ABC-type multidrug transport system permease subunit
VRFAGIAAAKDLRRRLADPAALLIWIGMPVVIGTLMSLLNTGGSDASPKAHLLVVDEDRTFVSGLVARAGSAGALGNFLDVVEVTRDDGQKRMDKGDASAMLILPAGFQAGVLQDTPVNITLLKNPVEQIFPQIIEQGLDMAIEAVFYLQRVAGPDVRRAVDMMNGRGSAMPDQVLIELNRLFTTRVQALRKTLAPPLISLSVSSNVSASGGFDFGKLFLPGLLFMAIMFTAQGMSNDIWTEKTRGTLRRTLTTPQGASAFLAGKLLAGMVIMTAAAAVALGLGLLAFHVSPSRVPLALAWSVFTGAALFTYLVLIQVISTTARGGQLLSTLIVFPLIMIGGSFFPFEMMPAWMAAVGRWTPNGLGVAHLKDLLFGPINPAALAVAAVLIGLPAVAAFYASVRRLSGAFAIS